MAYPNSTSDMRLINADVTVPGMPTRWHSPSLLLSNALINIVIAKKGF